MFGQTELTKLIVLIKGLVTNHAQSDSHMSDAEKSKLAGLNNYTHPSSAAYTNGLYKITTNNLGHVTSASPVTKTDITNLGIPASYTASEVGADTSGSAKTVQDNLDTHMEDLVSHLSSNEHTNFTDAVSKKHSHSNKSVLDGITSTLISDWNNAVSHSNDLSIHITTGEKDKLSNIEDNANNYSLPTASSNILGGVKTGSNITNSSGTISLTQANIIAALGYTPSSTSSAGFPTIVAKTKPTTVTANSCFIKLNT